MHLPKSTLRARKSIVPSAISICFLGEIMFPNARYFMLMMTAMLLAFSLAVTASPRVITILEEIDQPWSIDWISPEEVLIT